MYIGTMKYFRLICTSELKNASELDHVEIIE